MPKSNIKFQNVQKKCYKKARMGGITQFFNKTVYNFAKILPEIGFFYTNIVCTFVLFLHPWGRGRRREDREENASTAAGHGIVQWWPFYLYLYAFFFSVLLLLLNTKMFLVFESDNLINLGREKKDFFYGHVDCWRKKHFNELNAKFQKRPFFSNQYIEKSFDVLYCIKSIKTSSLSYYLLNFIIF